MSNVGSDNTSKTVTDKRLENSKRNPVIIITIFLLLQSFI